MSVWVPCDTSDSVYVMAFPARGRTVTEVTSYMFDAVGSPGPVRVISEFRSFSSPA